MAFWCLTFFPSGEFPDKSMATFFIAFVCLWFGLGFFK